MPVTTATPLRRPPHPLQVHGGSSAPSTSLHASVSRCSLWLLTRCLRHRPDALTGKLMRMSSQCNTDVSATGPSAHIRRLTMGLQQLERARDLAYSLFSSASTTTGLAARGPLQHQQRHFPCTGGDPEERRRRRRRAVLILLPRRCPSQRFLVADACDAYS